MTEEVMAMISTIGTLLFMIAIFIGAYFVSKMIGGHYQNGSVMGKPKIQVIEKKVVGRDQSLILVKIADKTVLLGVTQHGINKIETFESDVFGEEENIVIPQANFLEVLKNASKKYKSDKKHTGKDETR